ncbi:MAG: NAD(P)-binding protein, partial [Bacteroidales bacterium]
MVKANRVPVRGQDPAERVTNFNEVSYGYNSSEAVLEASRCIQCKNPRCVAGCPVSIQIPTFIKAILDGNMAQAATIIAADSSLPAICGRVCPQEVQCEGACILGIKHQPISIGKLERYVADWAKENQFSTAVKPKPNGKKVAIIGSGPAGLACATDLARAGCEVTIFEALHK